MEEEEEGRNLAKERCLPPNLILTLNLVVVEEGRERKMTTYKLVKCFSSNRKETGGMLTEGKEEGEEEVKTTTTGLFFFFSDQLSSFSIQTLRRARNRHSYYEGQDRRGDNFQMAEAASAAAPNATKRGSQDEYSNYRNSRGSGGR